MTAGPGSRTRLRSVVADVLHGSWRREQGLHASASACVDGELLWLASTSQAAASCGDWAEGPPSAAVEQDTPIVIEDLREETRWPYWRHRALEQGFRSAMVVPYDGGASAVVTVLRERLGPWTQDEQGTAACHARAIAGAVLLAGTGREVHRTGRPRTQAEVERAVGMVMAQRRCSSHEALATLMESAHRQHSALPDVCSRVATLVAGSLSTAEPAMTRTAAFRRASAADADAE